MKAKKVKLTPYNPRKMTPNAQQALRSSMEAFQDISGIVWNVRTGNLVSGNHRWEELVAQYEEDGIDLVKIHPDYDYYMINGFGEFTGYLLREVDWDEDTEKAANIAANSEKLQGEFTNALGPLLEEIQEKGSSISEGLFIDLRFNDLKMDFSEIKVNFDTSNEFDLDDGFDDEFDEDELETKPKDVLLKDEDDTEQMAIIKVRCSMSKRTEIVEKLKNALINENDIKID